MAHIYMFTVYDDMVDSCPKRQQCDRELLAEMQAKNIPSFPLPYDEFMKHKAVFQTLSMKNLHLHIMFICDSYEVVLVCNNGHFRHFPSQEAAVRSIYKISGDVAVVLDRYKVV